MFKKTIVPLAAAATLMLGSCAAPKDYTYFQDVKPGDVIPAGNQLDIRLKPEDKLMISVSAQDPTLSQLFNLHLNNNSGGGGSNGNLQGYTIDPEGNISFPVLGKLHLAGMRRSDVAQYIEGLLVSKDLVKTPIVTVEFMNTGFTVLGAIGGGGRVDFNKDRLNIIDGIALAGDLSANARRDNILVLREMPDGRKQAYTVNLMNLEELTKSPVYYLQQNDIIYVDETKLSKLGRTPLGTSTYTPGFWFGMASTVIGFGTLITTLAIKK